MNGQRVDFRDLPSKGYGYPKDIEIYVKPLSIKEQINTERYGISDAEYFRIILDGITIEGDFNKMNLLHSDVQFLDIVRRLFSFDTKEKITIEDCICEYPDCQHKFNYSFRISDISFSDFSKDIFGKHYILGENTEDELEIVVSPVTVSEYISMSRQFRNYKGSKDALTCMYTDYMCTCIRELVDRNFKDKKERDAFLRDYIENLYTARDKKVLRSIVDETLIKIEPFKTICEECDREVSIVVSPTSNFQQ